ncbi:hypothetical protein DFJ73DRAFT_898272 [Zopfochytrium polystomum]|nr:hypothetical protein DFJ73DRAFT_898272 [Zopfochytrium polystomum]
MFYNSVRLKKIRNIEKKKGESKEEVKGRSVKRRSGAAVFVLDNNHNQPGDHSPPPAPPQLQACAAHAVGLPARYCAADFTVVGGGVCIPPYTVAVLNHVGWGVPPPSSTTKAVAITTATATTSAARFAKPAQLDTWLDSEQDDNSPPSTTGRNVKNGPGRPPGPSKMPLVPDLRNEAIKGGVDPKVVRSMKKKGVARLVKEKARVGRIANWKYFRIFF